MKLRALVLTVSCLLGFAYLGPTRPALAALASMSVSNPVVGEAADYASEVLADPWDFTNQADVSGPAKIGSGALTFVPSGKSQPSLLGSTASSQPWGRDGRLHPLNANRYTVLTIRSWVDKTSRAGLSWTRCSWATTGCRGYFSYMMKPGWNRYDLPIRSAGLTSAPAPWSGPIVGLRLTGQAGTTIKVDYVRVRAAVEPVVHMTVQGNTDPNVYWDVDADTSNNTLGSPGWGVAGSGGTTRDIPVGWLANGRYRFYVPAYDPWPSPSELSTWITIQARPRPVMVTPNAAQGADWAKSVRHDPWDMSQRTDFGLRNARILGAKGRWFAFENTSNDPWVSFGVGKGFSGSTYHRVLVNMSYSGPYGLANAPGGGCVGRILWTTARGGPTKWQTTDDLVLYPGWNTIELDMATSPSTAIVDPALGANRIGWAGQTITQLRFDPNEDPGRRHWTLEDVKVTADPVAKGRFDVQFKDLVSAPGTTARVDAIDAKNQVRNFAANVPVKAGVNTVSWTPTRAVPPGPYRFRVTITNGGGSVTTGSKVPVRVTPA